jgi:LysR family hydrogen peroxide-inducible transcriptional activator
MNISQLSIRDLEYIVQVAHDLHYGKAAITLHVSQPTLSEQIKKLESLLGLKIFERSKKSVQVTPQGLELIITAKKILVLAHDFISAAKEIAHPLVGKFRLGAIATVGPYFLPYVIGPLKKSYPKLELMLEEGMTADLLEKLDNAQIDAVIASRTFDEKKYRVYTLFKEPFWLVAPVEKKINTRAGKVSITNIDKSELILLKDGNCLKDEVLNFCSITKDPTSAIQATSIETLLYLVAGGNGLTFIPELAISTHKKIRSLLKFYAFAEKNVAREIVLVTRETHPRPEEIRLLYKKLKEHLPSLGTY